MNRFLPLGVVLALAVGAAPCAAERPDAGPSRQPPERATLRPPKAAPGQQTGHPGPGQGDFTGVLRERLVTLQLAPSVWGISPYREERRLVIDLGKGLCYDLIVRRYDEEQKARAWIGKKVAVRGSVQTVARNPLARELPFPPAGLPVLARPATFTVDMNPPSRWVLVVEHLGPTDRRK